VTDRMRIVLDLELPLWWQLAGVAERKGSTVTELLMSVAEELGTGAHLTRRTAPSRERPHYDRDWLDSAVLQAHKAGLNDSAAAARVGCSPETVRRVRNRLGLPQLGRRSAA
jgi:hypothetical protein